MKTIEKENNLEEGGGQPLACAPLLFLFQIRGLKAALISIFILFDQSVMNFNVKRVVSSLLISPK